MGRQSKGTTKTGYVNPNGQVVIRDTGEAGTDFAARNFQLACSQCGHNYGANSGDIWERKCPNCQGGREGLPLRMGAHAH
jgi:Zn finger protein HypA/HybF involved in hydrogenase expression